MQLQWLGIERPRVRWYRLERCIARGLFGIWNPRILVSVIWGQAFDGQEPATLTHNPLGPMDMAGGTACALALPVGEEEARALSIGRRRITRLWWVVPASAG